MSGKTSVILRAAGAIGATLAVVGGVTYAQVTGNVVTLSDNTISTSSTNSALKISKVNTNFRQYVNGFNFTGLTPGSRSTSNAETFFLRNTGNTDLAIDMYVPSLPTWNVTPSGTVNNSRIRLNVLCNVSGGGTLSSTAPGNELTTLNTAPGETLTGTLGAHETATCSVNVVMAANAISNPSATNVTSSGFDIEFTGTSTI